MRMDRGVRLLGAVCLLTTGCFSYGPYGHPGAFAPPPHTAMAPQPYGAPQIPPGAVWIPASPSGVAGSATVAAPAPARRMPVPVDVNEETPGGNPVPVPVDPGKSQPTDDVDSFGYDEETRIERRDTRTSQRSRPRSSVNDEPIELAGAQETDLDETEMASTADDELPLVDAGLQTAEFTTQVKSKKVKPVGAQGGVVQADKYGYDAQSYSWLKGVLEFDPREQVWHLTYSQNPDVTDQLGGEVTIKNTAHFKYARNGEFLQVEGELDLDSRDRLGKPLYTVTRIIRPVAVR